MSLEDLTTGDTIIKQLEASATGSSWGQSESHSDVGAALDCRIDTISGSETLKYEARGAMYTHCVMFSSDPAIGNIHRLKWTASGGVDFSAPKYLRVLAAYHEGRPGETMLWIVDCQEETTRKKSG